MVKKKDLIDVAHPHTIRKFELIEKYIKSWAQKLMLNDNCNSIVFIDCMLYKDYMSTVGEPAFSFRSV